MKSRFLIIDKSVLPEYFEQVVSAVKLIGQEGKSVSDACKIVGISRSTFYKYKDKVFELSQEYGKKTIISLRAENESGVLSNVLNRIAYFKGNILTINQDMPIHNMAYITVTIDAKDLDVSIVGLIEDLKQVPKVREVNLLAFE